MGKGLKEIDVYREDRYQGKKQKIKKVHER